MTSTRQTAVIKGDNDMNTDRQTTTAVATPRTIALVTGVLFVITYLTSIPPVLFLYVPVLHDPRYIVGAGADTGALWGAFLELLLIVANIGTTVVLFPILKRVNEIFALGFVTARVVESVFIAVGVVSLFGVVEPGSVAGSIMVVPEFIWELSLGIWLIVKGFNPSPFATQAAQP